MPTLVSESKTIRHELWTADDFLDWLEPGIHADLIDGEKFMHSPVNLRHADLTNFVDFLLRSHIEKHRLGKLYREVVAVRLGSRNVFLPDLARRPPANRKQWIFARGGAGAECRVAFRKRNPDQPFGKRIRTERFERLASIESREEERESQRLLYVAMTRAMDALVLPIHDEIRDKESWHAWLKEVLREE